MQPSLIEVAMQFATARHIGQQRRYTGEPYWQHLENVALTVEWALGSTDNNIEIIAAAWLHDVVEDTDATFGELEEQFGRPVMELVWWCSDLTPVVQGNRALRKHLAALHYGGAPRAAQNIKLADLIDNTRDIVEHDPKFARTYLAEKRALLPHLWRGHADLYREAKRLLEDGERKLSND